MALSKCLLLTSLVCLVSDLAILAAAQDEVQQKKNDAPPSCGLYMAESSIPNSGWGMYTATPIQKDDVIYPLDVVIQVADYARYQTLRSSFFTGETLPLWLMEEYYWNSQTTWAWYDAQKVQSIVPGLGMLANSHPGLVNAAEQGPQYKQVVPRNVVEAGAYSQYKNTTFLASTDIPAGHEIMVQYGDHWFKQRGYAFGESIPLSQDYETADEIVQEAVKQCNASLETDSCKNLWNTTRETTMNTTNARVYSALPKVLTQDVAENGTARHSVPNVVRSIEWLQENGMCLDHLSVRDESTIPHAGSGAFATRNLPNNTIVAPAPVVHMHRGHLEIILPDTHDDEQVHWQGHQLLLNYMYSHPSTSLIFFPYSPAVNLINHAPPNMKPNVQLRWSDRMAKSEWLNLTTEELIQENEHAGLMMELVAIRDIREGDEILLDYGQDWQEAWERHVETWRKPMDRDTHRSAEEFKKLEKLPTKGDVGKDDVEQLPGNLMTVCWVDWEDVKDTEDPNTFIWTSDHETDDQTQSRKCTLLSRMKKNGKYRYTAEVRMDGETYIFQNMLRRGIDVVDRPYAANQFLRQSFRHEIQLPDDMIPDNWKDLEAVGESCGMYMAESSIPNSGLGMFTGKTVKDSQGIGFPGIVIQAPDVDENNELRHEYVGAEYDPDEPAWLLENYFWNAPYTGGFSEARDIQSIVPGIGMLANSHTGAFNALSRLASRDNAGIRPMTDPGAGASTTYHGMRYLAHNGDLPAGAEIFVEYGDHWFDDQKDRLGLIPLSGDFRAADALLVEFWETIGGDPDKESSKEAWKEFLKTSKEKEHERVYLALPQKLEDVEYILDYGTGLYNVRDSIKPVEWLEENGRCLDNIKPAVSNIPHAGYGAFATRHMKKGDVVAPAPLVQLNHFQMLIMEESHDPDDPETKEVWAHGEQLIKNYCFGHQNSSMLLYPYSPTVNYINHDSVNYNAELRWSELPNHKSEWLNQSVEELVELDHAGLIMEFVATRDIAPGEEILIDYGERWQQAWDEHVKSWKPPSDYEDYSPAWELNDYTLPVRTQEEQKARPYPKNVWIGCYVGAVDQDQSGSLVDGKLEYKWEYEPDIYHTTLQVNDCEVLKRYKESIETADSIRSAGELYKIKIQRHSQMPLIITDVPRRAIQFYDYQYMSDLDIREAFRHEMDIPDDLFPEAWKDVEEKEEAEEESEVGEKEEEKTHSTEDEL